MDTIFENGLTYYKLVSNYSGDTTKNCGLIGSEIDNNFYTLRGHDIESVAFSGNTLILRRLNGSEIHVNIDQTPEITEDNLTFRYDKNSGNLTIEYPNGETSEISGFTNNALTEIYTNSTLDGNGTLNNPLGVSVTETTGAYSPAKEYVELNPGEELSSENAKPGDRIVTKEIIDNFGRLYSPEGVEIISDYLDINNSEWRIPSKYDWDLLLDSLEDEHAEEGYIPHSAETIGLLGEDAAQPLKSDFLWEFNDNPITEDGTCGFDVVGFNIIPVGGDYDGDKTSEEFNRKSTMWTSTITEDGYYTKEFMYDTNKVGQNIADKGFFSIRLVKDFDGSNYKGVETIFGQSYPTTLIPETNQIWTSINVYATKKQIIDLSKGENFIEVNKENADFENVQTTFYINEWDGNEWVKKELKEGDSIVITQRDIDEGITRYYRRWFVKDGELQSFEDYVGEKFEEIQTEFSNAIESARTDFDTAISNLETSFTNTINALSGSLATKINQIDARLDSFINNEVEGVIKDTIKSYITDTMNEITIFEEGDKLRIGFSDNAIFG